LRDQGRGLTGKSSSWTAFMYLRLVCCGITHLTAQGPSRTCNERQDEEDSGRAKAGGCVTGLSRRLGWASFSGATLARCHFLEPPWQDVIFWSHLGKKVTQPMVAVSRSRQPYRLRDFSQDLRLAGLGKEWALDTTPQTVTSKVSTGASKHLYQARPRTVIQKRLNFVPGTSANHFQKRLCDFQKKDLLLASVQCHFLRGRTFLRNAQDSHMAHIRQSRPDSGHI